MSREKKINHLNPSDGRLAVRTGPTSFDKAGVLYIQLRGLNPVVRALRVIYVMLLDSFVPLPLWPYGLDQV